MVSGTAAESGGSNVPPVRAILSHSKGFFCCCGNGLVHGYERSDEKDREYYKKVKEIEVPTAMSDVQGSQIFVDVGREVTAIALSPSEDSLVCSTQGQQLYTLMLSSAEISKVWDSNPCPLLSMFDFSKENGLSLICYRIRFTVGPLLVWAFALESRLLPRVPWIKRSEYGTMKPSMNTPSVLNLKFIVSLSVLELQKDFPEEAYSVALHPSGLFLLAGFSDKLRLMNLLIDDIRPFKEFTLRGCREVNTQKKKK